MSMAEQSEDDTLPLEMTEEQYLSWTKTTTHKSHFLSDVDLARVCPLDNYQISEEPKYDLGVFDRLPLELQQAILNQVDLQALVDFRRVNKRALQVIDSIPEYRNIITDSPDSLRAMLSTETATQASCVELWTELTRTTCIGCSDFTSLIYLPMCARICFICNRRTTSSFPLTPTEAGRRYGISNAIVNTLPKFKIVPGVYSEGQRKCRTRSTLIDRETARDAGVERHGSQEAMEEYVTEQQKKVSDKYSARKRKVKIDGKDAKVRRPKRIEPSDRGEENDRRFVAVIRAPPIDKITMTAQQGRYCLGCDERDWRREYNKITFAEHIEKYGPVEETARGVMEHPFHLG